MVCRALNIVVGADIAYPWSEYPVTVEYPQQLDEALAVSVLGALLSLELRHQSYQTFDILELNYGNDNYSIFENKNI